MLSNAQRTAGTWIAAMGLFPPIWGPDITSFFNVTFTLDGQLVGTFQRTPNTTGPWLYNQTLFASQTLENKAHTLIVQPQAGKNSSFFAFDYFMYE